MKRTRPSIAIGPLNTASQATEWAEALNGQLLVEAVSFADWPARGRGLRRRPHTLIPHNRLHPRSIRSAFVERLLAGRTHLLTESLMPMFSNPHVNLVTQELERLQMLGIKVGTVFHGSDIRDIRAHLERVPDSFCALWSDKQQLTFERARQWRMDALSSAPLPTLVSTPDLLLDVPTARWLPIVVRPATWEGPRHDFRAKRPVVVHVPSRRDPPIKGTDVIDSVLSELHEQGIVEYVAPSHVPHAQMPLLINRADIVIEQLRSGVYGVGAVEAMAAGRPVIGFVAPDVRDLIGEHVPIVDARLDQLRDVVLSLIDKPKLLCRLGDEGRNFVASVHSGRKSAEILSDFCG